MHKVVALILAASVLVPSFAFAQGHNSEARCAGTSSTGANSRDQAFCFDAEIVNADNFHPSDPRTHILRPHSGPSLIRLREHFVPEMLKSVESI